MLGHLMVVVEVLIQVDLAVSIEVAEPDNLVAAANVDHMVSRFHSLLVPDCLILTKLDEAADEAYLGHLLNTQAKYGLPLAYFTNGQRVPDDLSRPDPHVIADKLMPMVGF